MGTSLSKVPSGGGPRMLDVNVLNRTDSLLSRAESVLSDLHRNQRELARAMHQPTPNWTPTAPRVIDLR